MVSPIDPWVTSANTEAKYMRRVFSKFLSDADRAVTMTLEQTGFVHGVDSLILFMMSAPARQPRRPQDKMAVPLTGRDPSWYPKGCHPCASGREAHIKRTDTPGDGGPGWILNP